MKEFLVTVSSTAFVHIIVDEIEQDLEVHFKIDLKIIFGFVNNPSAVRSPKQVPTRV